MVMLLLASCDNTPKEISPEMEAEAKGKVLEYLEKHNLSKDGIVKFQSKAQPKPDIAYLYTGSGRCIEFVIYCYGLSCKEMRWYPYDEHGEKCP